MEYFEKFPIVDPYYVDGIGYRPLDITRRCYFTEDVKTDPRVYTDYRIENGETAIILADRLYDDPNLHWIILLFNDIYDVSSQWPLDQVSFDRFMERKYGSDRYALHHYESFATGNIVDFSHPAYDRRLVTNNDYEVEINEAKRDIKLPVPTAIATLTKQYTRLIQE